MRKREHAKPRGQRTFTWALKPSVGRHDCCNVACAAAMPSIDRDVDAATSICKQNRVNKHDRQHGICQWQRRKAGSHHAYRKAALGSNLTFLLSRATDPHNYSVEPRSLETTSNTAVWKTCSPARSHSYSSRRTSNSNTCSLSSVIAMVTRDVAAALVRPGCVAPFAVSRPWCCLSAQTAPVSGRRTEW